MEEKEITAFIRDYGKAIISGNAAVFAGAGLSQPAGFVNWRELLRGIAEDLGLDVDKETDLVAVAQYHVNESGGRSKLNQVLIDEYTKEAKITDNHEILARLPISTYWTTNYDQTIETALKSVRKRVDTKTAAANLAVTMYHADAVVYKMHGDISAPHDAVLTKDDYERYNDTSRRLFTTALQGDLVSKTFLFIGFSFSDPNLDYILSRIRVLLGNNQRPHFCFMKRVVPDGGQEGDVEYAKVKQGLLINDLKRFGIKVLLIDNYSEITEILKRVSRFVAGQNVFISGSAADYGKWKESEALRFVSQLSGALIREGFNIVSGFGLGVGNSVIAGAVEEIFRLSESVSSRLQSRPFPQGIPDASERKRIWTLYRTEMMAMSGIAIFVFGNKLVDGTVISANGMVEEFELGCKQGVIPIPVGSTGFAAHDLWTNVMNNFEAYVQAPGLVGLYQSLGDPNLPHDDLVNLILEIAKRLARP